MTLTRKGKEHDLKQQKRKSLRSKRNLRIAIYHLHAVQKREEDDNTARGIEDAIDALKATMDGISNRIDDLDRELTKL